MKHKIIPIFIPHEGCPHDCSFCNQKKIAGKERSPEEREIRERIAAVRRSNQGVEHRYILAYYGGSFTAIDEKRQVALLRLAQRVKEDGLIHGIRISTRPDYLTGVHVQRLKEHGVDFVEIGVQSTDPTVNEQAGRPTDQRILREGVENLRNANISYGVQMMVGLPGDSLVKTYQTTVDLLSLKPESLRIYPCLVLKDTLLETLYLQGAYRPLGLEEAIDWSLIPYVLFANRNIPVIRMGLHASESLQGEGAFIAGPFHPGFGEFVVSSVYYHLMEDAWKNYPNAQRELHILVDPKTHSKIVGNRSFVTKKLKDRLDVNLRVQHQNGLGPDVILLWQSKKITLSFREFVLGMEEEFHRKFNARK